MRAEAVEVTVPVVYPFVVAQPPDGSGGVEAQFQPKMCNGTGCVSLPGGRYMRYVLKLSEVNPSVRTTG